MEITIHGKKLTQDQVSAILPILDKEAEKAWSKAQWAAQPCWLSVKKNKELNGRQMRAFKKGQENMFARIISTLT